MKLQARTSIAAYEQRANDVTVDTAVLVLRFRVPFRLTCGELSERSDSANQRRDTESSVDENPNLYLGHAASYQAG